MSKEELLKYLIAEIDLIMHDKDYRFENANGTWYSRESCKDLTNEEVFEELRTELRQLADLETKLAEKDKAIENWQTMYESVVQTCHNDKEEIERLNKQLAEKEKEIKAKETLNQIFKDNRENKISFCIEHLEKVKEYANKEIKELNKLLEETNDYYYYIQAVGARIYDFKRMINQQINELKGKVEDEKRN